MRATSFDTVDVRLYGLQGDGADLFVGAIGNESLIGGAGLDTLQGDLGNYTPLRGSGADTLSGGNRNDATVVCGDGTDPLDGGAGSDVLEIDSADTLVLGSGDTSVADVFTLLPSWIDAL